MKFSAKLNRAFRHATIKMQFVEIQAFVDTVENALKTSLEAVDQRWRNAPDGLSEDEFEEYQNRLSLDSYYFRNAFPALVRKDVVIQVCVTVERILHSLSKTAHEHGGLAISTSDYRPGRGIKKWAHYLRDVAGVEVPLGGADWQSIDGMIKLRNWMVHPQSKPFEKQLEQHIKSKAALLEVTHQNQIRLRPGYCKDAIDTAKQFCLATLDEMPDALLESGETAPSP